MADLKYGTEWFARAIRSHEGVTRASALPNGHVRLERRDFSKRDLEPITVAPLFVDRVDTTAVECVLATAIPTVILLIPKASHYDWDARELAEGHGSTIHTVKELYTFVQEADLRPLVDKNVSYVLDRLNHHTSVEAIDMICEASMLITRRDGLSAIVAAIEYEYEFSEEALVRAIKHHPDADVVVNTNPNGKPTEAALTHAESAGVPVYGIAGVMRALNFDGDEFRRCAPHKRS
jgi:hypothetical protein